MQSWTKHHGMWLAVGGVFAVVSGLFGYFSARPDSLVAGLISGTASGLFVIAARRLWVAESQSPAPISEYLAAVWALSYIALLALTATQRTVSVVDAIILSPPVGFLPLVLRRLLGDDGDPRGPARSAAFRVHRVLAWLQIAIGGLAVVSLFYVFVAPLQLIPGLMHLRAAFVYRTARNQARTTQAGLGLSGRSLPGSRDGDSLPDP